MPQLRGRLATDRFELERRVGQGTSAAVYVAFDKRTNLRVALKVMHQVQARSPLARRRFLREAQAAQRLATPHAVQVLDVGELADGTPFMVMELLEGRTLRAVIDECGPMTQERALYLADQVAAALQDAHANGVVHRDLKPENAFVLGEGPSEHVKVVDFGISKIVAGAETSALTGTGMLVGTPLYMAPEQLRGASDVDHRADIYALGVVLYELFAGASPFAKATDLPSLLRIVAQPVQPLSVVRPDLPQGLVDVVSHAMARRREDRVANVETLRLLLAPYWSGVGPLRDRMSSRLELEEALSRRGPEPVMDADRAAKTAPRPTSPPPGTPARLAALGPPVTRVPRPSRLPPPMSEAEKKR
jgi:serine/threonine protein kinase